MKVKHFELFILQNLLLFFIIIKISVFFSILIIKLDLNVSILNFCFIFITLNNGIITY